VNLNLICSSLGEEAGTRAVTSPSTGLLTDASAVFTEKPTGSMQPAVEAVTDSTESSRCPSVPDMMVSIVSSSVRVAGSTEHPPDLATSAAIAVTGSGEQPPGRVAETDAGAVTVSTEPAPQLLAAVHVSSRTESTESRQVAADTVTKSTEPLQPVAESNESSTGTSEPLASGLPKEQEAFQLEADESRETSTAGLSKEIIKVSWRILLFGTYSFFVQQRSV
jgi:hypothetical protein